MENLLNKCLNDALCGSNRIKGLPDSNKVAKFISKWIIQNKYIIKLQKEYPLYDDFEDNECDASELDLY